MVLSVRAFWGLEARCRLCRPGDATRRRSARPISTVVGRATTTSCSVDSDEPGRREWAGKQQGAALLLQCGQRFCVRGSQPASGSFGGDVAICTLTGTGERLDHERHETTRKTQRARLSFRGFRRFRPFAVQMPGPRMARLTPSDPLVMVGKRGFLSQEAYRAFREEANELAAMISGAIRSTNK
jgi:hypothetical protein